MSESTIEELREDLRPSDDELVEANRRPSSVEADVAGSVTFLR